MKTLTMNKGNWSGEEATIRILSTTETEAVFELYPGDEFRVSLTAPDAELGIRFVEVTYESGHDDRIWFHGWVDENEAQMGSMGVERDAPVSRYGSQLLAAVAASAQVLFNTY